MTAPASDADREFLHRVLDMAGRNFTDASACFNKARAYVREALTCLAKGEYEDAQDFYELASEKALRAIGLITKAEQGIDPAQLAARDNPKIVRPRGWMKNRDLTNLVLSPRAEFLAKVQDAAKKRDELGEMGLLFDRGAAKLSTNDILGAMSEGGWDNERIGKWYISLMEATENGGTVNQRVEVGRLVARVIQHTEPRQLFEISDVDIEGLSDEELDEITREAATVVAHRVKEAQQGRLPE